jgi:hypothetical protein
MITRKLATIGLILICFTGLNAFQEKLRSGEPVPIFLKATIYPTYSLARYDYNIDQDKIELRVFIDLRDRSRDGGVIHNAQVFVNGVIIPFESGKKDFRKNLLVKKSKLPHSIKLTINISDGRRIQKSFQFPGWVILAQPKPAVLNSDKDIVIRWEYSEEKFPVFLQADDFKKGSRLISHRNVKPGNLIKLIGKKIPANTIVRIWVTSEWFFKKYLSDPGVVRGSEINFLPWSQTFVRIKAEDK